MNPTCPDCKGEGGHVVHNDFVYCRSCNGHGFKEGRPEGFGESSPSPTPLSEPEPHDIHWGRLERASEDHLRRLEAA